MKIQTLTPMLRTWDLRASIAFYTEVLGFECETLSEEWGWASLRQDGAAIMFASPNQHESDKAPAFTGSLYFHTDDADGLWQRLKGKARVCYPIENFEYGMREFGIYDNKRLSVSIRPTPANRTLTSAFLKVARINTGTLVPHNRGDQFGKNAMADIYFRS